MRQRHLRIARTGGAVLLMLALLLCLPAAPARAADSQWRNIVDVVAGEAYTAALRDDGQVLYTGRRSAYDPFEAEKWTGVERLELAENWPNYLVGYFRDGSVRVGGPDDYGTFDLSSCRDVAQVQFSGAIAAVLHRDGRVSVVLAGGEQVNSWDQEAAALYQQRVPQWRDITQVCFAYGEEGPVLVGLRRDGTLACTDAAWEKAHKGWDHVERLFFTYLGGGVMGLRRDGTLLGTEDFAGGPWTKVARMYQASDSFFALTRDGRVLVGESGYRDDKRMRDVASWRNVTQLGFDVNGIARFVPTALLADGTVAVPMPEEEEAYPPEYQWDTGSWSMVKTLYSGAYYTLGLRADGTVLATAGEFDKAPFVDAVGRWTDIAALFPSCTYETAEAHIVGLRMDGTLVAAGNNECGQCGVNSF